MGLLRSAARLVPGVASGAAEAAGGAAGLAWGAAEVAVQVPRRAVRALPAPPVPRPAPPVLPAAMALPAAVSGLIALHRPRGLPRPLPRPPGWSRIADLSRRAELGALVGTHGRRRVWASEGRACIELHRRAVGRAREAAELRRAVGAAVRRLEGVDWAQVNAVTGEILCAFDEDALPVERLVAVIADVEKDHDLPDEPFPLSAHPADRAPVTVETIALASDCAALALAATGRLTRAPRLPGVFRMVLPWVDHQPRLRRLLERRLGPHGADLVLAVGNAALHGLTQEPAGLAVDVVHRVVLIAELNARRAAWHGWHHRLSAAGVPHEPPLRAERPVPLPDGPVEKAADRSALATLGGAAAVLALTRDPGTAADLVMATVPRAARFGRAGFAATLDRQLSRAGVVPLDGSCYLRLDRISAVVVDASVLCADDLEILSADDPSTWRTAARLLQHDPGLDGRPGDDGLRLERVADDGAGGVRVRVVDADGTARGGAVVGHRLDPLAEAVLTAARDGGVRVLLTENASTDELMPLADDALDPRLPLAEHVRRLQEEGHGVLVLTGADDDAALAADVGVGVVARPAAPPRGGEAAPPPDGAVPGPVCWGADLICTGGLEQAWRVLAAVRAAREASGRAVRLAAGGSALGALLVVTGRRATAPLNLAPMHSAALIALLGGVVSARRLAARPAPQPLPRVPWHALDPQAAAEQALKLRAAPPAQEPPRRRPPIFLPLPDGAARRAGMLADVARAVGHELRDPLTPVLVLGAAASAVVGSGVDAGLVGGVMAGNALISGVQRARAERALRELLLDQRPPVRRVRADGGRRPWDDPRVRRCEPVPTDGVPAAELRPGDVIALGPSDLVPADARLLAADDLEVDEASLTGESLPVAKSVEAVPGAEFPDRTCMLYQDTTVLTGRAYAVVVATGAATQAGRAAALAGRGAAPSGVQAQLNELTRVALPVTGLSGALVGALGLLRGASVRQAVSSGVAVSVAAVPEGLPLVATVAQLAAARRLSRRNVLVRSSRTLGTMGRVDTLCFDKTGTLTEGRLRVTTVSGPDGETQLDSALGRRVLTAAARACPQGRGAERPRHATDRAVLDAAAAHLGGDDGWRLVHETPFEPSRGFSAATGWDGDRPALVVKGAPEVVMERCDRVASAAGTEALTAERRGKARGVVQDLAERGLRVLAVAEARPDASRLDEGRAALDGERLTLLGFVGIADPPRRDAADAIRTLTEAGIRVVVITGDHPATAQAVAAELGVPHADRVLTGAELDRLSDRHRAARIARTSVFARVGPEHKVRIVQALRRAGRVVAMTGDGANDAAAIRLADVGIGLSAGDSAAARSAADLILPGSDLPGITEALLEGRMLWQSVRNAVSILVGGNAGEIAFTVYGTAVGGRAPLSTRQLLLVNMLTDMMPALAVALAPPDGDGERPARRGPFGDPLYEAIAARGLVTALGSILAWQIGRLTGRRRRAGTMGLAALVITQLAQTLQMGRHSPAVLATCAASVLVLAVVIETPGLSHFFGSVPLGPGAWTVVLGSAAVAAAVSVLGPRLLRRLLSVKGGAVKDGAVKDGAVKDGAVNGGAVNGGAVDGAEAKEPAGGAPAPR
ncbi:putative cation-transporting ATPase I [Actinomadura sp. NBRC 104425]|uniref:HAD-IC family P-type ATPase n=1 Tax=Actinomadura sp. NBRC 104425 TaxID=3032204 RepID=UPI0024A5CB7F|nr:HAD-IC family P-type ATPase [Actinomadura sp. NBRC 104425]GLZ12395.1 putative cation-transporting ATPase I [Actinomadura sp. NBRC 104425]